MNHDRSLPTWPRASRTPGPPRDDDLGRIVVLNGAPRAGKSSIVDVIQRTFDGVWLNIGVDVFGRGVIPPALQPGIGLRPGGERPDLEAFVPKMYAALYDSVVAHSHQGLNVVVDVGHHDGYSKPLGVLADVAGRLHDLQAFFIGVRCPVDVVLERRDATWPSWRDGMPGVPTPEGEVPEPVLRREECVHTPGIYDLEVDTSLLSPIECAAAIRRRMDTGPPSAFAQLAASADSS